MYVITRLYGKSAYVLLQWKRKVFKFFTGVRVEPNEFNEKTGKINTNVPGVAILQKQIDDWRVLLLTTALQLEREGNELTQSLIRHVINGNNSISNAKLEDTVLSEAFATYILHNKLRLRPSTQRHYGSTQAVIKEYEETLSKRLLIKAVNEDILRKFQLHLFETRGCNDNTVAKYMKRIQAVLRYMKPENDWSFIKYKSYIPDVVFLYESELQLLRQVILHGYLEKTRDLLLFSCYTGMRYSDTQNYNSSWEQNDLIIYNQQKTDVEAIVPLFSIAKVIVKKYRGCPPKISGQKFNKHLKELFVHLNLNRLIAQVERKAGYKIITNKPICEIVSSHIGRKTFIMQALMRGATVQDVMDMSGHSDYRAMKPYITRHKAHLKKLNNLWDNS